MRRIAANRKVCLLGASCSFARQFASNCCQIISASLRQLLANKATKERLSKRATFSATNKQRTSNEALLTYASAVRGSPSQCKTASLSCARLFVCLQRRVGEGRKSRALLVAASREESVPSEQTSKSDANQSKAAPNQRTVASLSPSRSCKWLFCVDCALFACFLGRQTRTRGAPTKLRSSVACLNSLLVVNSRLTRRCELRAPKPTQNCAEFRRG